MDDPRLAIIRQLAEPILAQQGMELVELTCRPQGRQTHLQFLVDAVGGVSIQQCALVNRQIGQVLEESRLFEDPYDLEVSSPGLDRQLVSLRDFERALGEQLQIEAAEPDGRVREWNGMLLAVQPEALVLKTEVGNRTFTRTQIKRAKKVLPW
jgi:ribosome maturation factor RimP